MTRPRTQITLVISLLGDIFILITLLLIGVSGRNPALVAAALFTFGEILEKPGFLTGYRIKNYPAVHGLPRRYATILRFLSGLFLIVAGFCLTTAIIRLLADGYIMSVGLLVLFVTICVLFLKYILYWNTVYNAQRTVSQLLYSEAQLQRNGLLILTVTCTAVTAGRLGFPIPHGLASLLISVLVTRLGIGFCVKGTVPVSQNMD